MNVNFNSKNLSLNIYSILFINKYFCKYYILNSFILIQEYCRTRKNILLYIMHCNEQKLEVK